MSHPGSQSLLFVLGMHRSGTSALCAALAACGASFGSQLIDAMAGVNDEGFWEDAGVVEVNERLLVLADSTWYAPSPNLEDTDWADAQFHPPREQARQLLRDNFGQYPLRAVKDPRLCLTLPFWLSLCEEEGIAVRVCVINRSPIEVAGSLEKRDGFPPGYGLRLYARYRACIDRFVPADALYVDYNKLLQDASSVMDHLATELPLRADPTGLAAAVRNDLRHQLAGDERDLLSQADADMRDRAALEYAIETRYPLEEALQDFSRRFTARGRQLAQIGREHSVALATLDERDADIAALSTEHRQALATLDERDADIAALSAEHRQALATLDERDADIAALSAEHRRALATLDERDADIESLSAEHRQALATVDERDAQVREFDRRLSELGDEHAHALQVLRERDAELAWNRQRLERVGKIPGVGYLLRLVLKHA